MWWPWGGGSDKPTGHSPPQNDPPKPPQDATAHLNKAAADAHAKHPSREKLPPKLQKIIEKEDKEENFFDELVEG